MESRLAGHQVRRGDHVLLIEDVAHQGRPWVGVVVVRCGQLWLKTAVIALRFTGPLARARIAGPGYMVWATGVRRAVASGASGDDFELLRLGVLARPDEFERPAAPDVAPCAEPQL
jgi:hypothetical protein